MASSATGSDDVSHEESATPGGVMSGVNQESGPDDGARGDARGGRVDGGGPTRLSLALKALYRCHDARRRQGE